MLKRIVLSIVVVAALNGCGSSQVVADDVDVADDVANGIGTSPAGPDAGVDASEE